MKKTLIINIGNSIIHFEEAAYDKLTVYLNSIKVHFAGTSDNYEIVSDIENRLAELLLERLSVHQKQVVDLEDADVVMNQMGAVSDFETDEPKDQNVFNTYTSSSYRRLFRDVDDRILAGVCSGVGHYLGIEAKWVRLITFLSIFLGGAGVVAYFILWIIMPTAYSRAEKMAMHGEPADLQGFKRNYEEELSAFRAKFGPDALYTSDRSHIGRFVSEFMGLIGKVIETAAKVFVKVLAIFIIVTGSAFLITLLIGLAALTGIADANLFEYFPLNIFSQEYRSEFLLAIFVTAFIPALALVLLSIRVVFNRKAINKTLSFALLTIWLCGVSFTTYYIAKVSSDFKQTAEISQTTAIQPAQIYTLNLDNTMLLSKKDSIKYELNFEQSGNSVILNDDHNDPFDTPDNVAIRFEPIDAGTPSLLKRYRASGKSFDVALRNARNIEYGYAINGDVFTFNPNLVLKEQQYWRDQNVRLVFNVPVGTKFRIQRALARYVDFYYWDCHTPEAAYTMWEMTNEGLKCIDSATAEPVE